MVRRSLVVAEVALALVLLVASGLMLRTLDRFFSVAPGFEPSRVITMQVQVVGPPLRPGQRRAAVSSRACSRRRARCPA